MKDKKILWQQRPIVKEDVKRTTFVNNIFIDSWDSMISISLEKCGTMKVNVIKMSMEAAQDIGFINFDKLSDYIN